jgi:DNA-binding transcriptional regulator YiaG
MSRKQTGRANVNSTAADEWRRRWATAIKTQRREVLHMSQHELAAHLDASQASVSGWETATSVPEDLMKVRVLALMALDPRELFRPLDADPIDKVSR